MNREGVNQGGMNQDDRQQKGLREEGKTLKRNKTLFLLLAAAIIAGCMLFGPDPLFKFGGAYAQNSGISETQLLARAINGEARGEPYEGQVAVGAVIINRTKNASFPKTIAGVIYQPGAFTAVTDGQINVPIDPNSSVVKAAQDALNGWDPTDGCIYYYNPATATSSWIWSRQVVKKIGKHNFAK